MSIVWTDNLAVGNKKIDDQHKELFRQINVLYDACSRGEGKKSLSELVNFLENYVVEHFSSEEELMKKSNYPGYDNHKRLHQEFVLSFAALKQQIQAEGTSLSSVIKTNKMLADWLRNHIMATDKLLGKYLRDNK